MDALVIGAGVCGLTTGISLAEAGLDVTIRTAAPPQRTTSVAAGAVWGATKVGPPDKVLEWGRTGLDVLTKLAAEPGTGVRMASGREVSRNPLEPYYWTELLPEPAAVPSVRAARRLHAWLSLHRAAGHHAGLPGLPDRPVHAGRRPHRSIAGPVAGRAGRRGPGRGQLPGRPARELVPDPAVQPVRGQVVIVANPGLEEFLINRDDAPPWITYMFPHGDTVLLGGTNEEGELGSRSQNLP